MTGQAAKLFGFDRNRRHPNTTSHFISSSSFVVFHQLQRPLIDPHGASKGNPQRMGMFSWFGKVGIAE